MATFSIGDAAMSGVRIIREHPKAVLVWSLAYFVIVLSPQFVGLALLAPELMAGQELARSEDAAVATDLQGRTVSLQLIQIVTSLLWSAVFYGAVYRAVLEPENSSRWYVRFGNQEFLVVVAVLIALGLGGGVMASGLGRFDGSGPLAWPALLTAGVAISILTTVAYTLMVAPSAAIYQRLRESPAPAQAA